MSHAQFSVDMRLVIEDVTRLRSERQRGRRTERQRFCHNRKRRAANHPSSSNSKSLTTCPQRRSDSRFRVTTSWATTLAIRVRTGSSARFRSFSRETLLPSWTTVRVTTPLRSLREPMALKKPGL